MKRIFSPPKGPNISEEITVQIEAAIVEGHFSPGERLPSEREFQNHFHSGRGAIREALRTLKQKGLIEIKKGAKGGAYVKKVEVNEASESLALLIKQRKIPLEYLIEFREAIDRNVATLALTRAKEGEHHHLLDLCDQLAEAVDEEPQNMDRVIEIDRQLNLTLVRMTRNPIFEWVMRTIQMGFGSYDYVLYQDPYYCEKTVANWRETARQIAAGEPLKALSSIGYHYVLLNRYLEERVEAWSTDLKSSPSAGNIGLEHLGVQDQKPKNKE